MKHRGSTIKRQIAMLMASLFLLLFFASCHGLMQETSNHQTFETISYYPENLLEMDLPSERLEILHFRSDCLESYYIGTILLDLLQTNYAQEVSEGIISYRKIQSEYLENQSLLMQYGAMKEDFISHLIKKDSDRIDQHHLLWYIAEDEEKVIEYLEKLINESLEKLN